MILTKEQDPMGIAISDFYQNKKTQKLKVSSPQFSDDEMPIDMLFRDEEHLLPMEQKALNLCFGKVLDIGAGAGCHSLILQKREVEVTAIDISPFSVEVMHQRGVKKVYNIDFFDDEFKGNYDVLLLLMNGSGIIGKLENIPYFFKKVEQHLNPDGCILLDSSDLCYIYEDENGNIDLTGVEGYYGEITYQMSYNSITGPSFSWLYIDFNTLEKLAKENGFKAECIQQGNHHDYLAKLTRY